MQGRSGGGTDPFKGKRCAALDRCRRWTYAIRPPDVGDGDLTPSNILPAV
jgi:hypothetical protein